MARQTREDDERRTLAMLEQNAVHDAYSDAIRGIFFSRYNRMSEEEEPDWDEVEEQFVKSIAVLHNMRKAMLEALRRK